MKNRDSVHPSALCHEQMSKTFLITLKKCHISFLSRLLPPGISIQPSCLQEKRNMKKAPITFMMGESGKSNNLNQKQHRGQYRMDNISQYISNESDMQNMKVSAQLAKTSQIKVKMTRQQLLFELTEKIKSWLADKNLIMNFTSQLEMIDNRACNLASNSKRLIFSSLREIVSTIEENENIKKQEIQTVKSIIYKCYKEYSGFSRCVHQIFVSREDTPTNSEEEMQRDKEKYGKKKKKRTTLAEKKHTKRKSLESIEQRDQSTILTETFGDNAVQTNQDLITRQDATAIHEILKALPQSDQRRLISTLHNDKHNLNLIRNLKKTEVEGFLTKMQQILSKRRIFNPEITESEEQRKSSFDLSSQRE